MYLDLEKKLVFKTNILLIRHNKHKKDQLNKQPSYFSAYYPLRDKKHYFLLSDFVSSFQKSFGLISRRTQITTIP